MKYIKDVISDIKELTWSKGYIYTLCMILINDSFVDPQKTHEIDHRSRLSTKELSLIIGFLIQKEINLSFPDSYSELINQKKKTYDLMFELHKSLLSPFTDTLSGVVENNHYIESKESSIENIFSSASFYKEPIFYSGDGVYDFQFLDYLEKKYKYDQEWLKENMDFDFYESKKIIKTVKRVIQKKIDTLDIVDFNETFPDFSENIDSYGKEYRDEFNEIYPYIELYQFHNLFFTSREIVSFEDLSVLTEANWRQFYEGLLDIFVIRKSNFEKNEYLDSFLDNFRLVPGEKTNSPFNEIGNFNLYNARPIIKIGDDRYFVPGTYVLHEAVYESPYYWMLDDKEYRNQLSINRGRASEEISFNILKEVFGSQRVFHAVKITSRKGYDDTDIDVLCVLGNKALCVQVKSKKLTELARTGDDDKLKEDFQKAVQDAYMQGLVARNEILKNNSKFFDSKGNQILLSNEINEVYILGITAENYPSLTIQTSLMLSKKEEDPFPLFLTVFDLELLAHYLNDPYEFMYYVRQRISLMDYFTGSEETAFLGYHLIKKLWKIDNSDRILIDTQFSNLIDRNFYPLKAGIDVADKGDRIKNRWTNNDFISLCDQIKKSDEPKITDLIFHLLDWSSDARNDFFKYIFKSKEGTQKDNQIHDFSLTPDENGSLRVGVSFISLNSNNSHDLAWRLKSLCILRKYKSMGNVWIGFGSLQNSSKLIDAVHYDDSKWIYNSEMEKASQKYLKPKEVMQNKRKLGRNDKCYCGSGLKYKNCCGGYL